MNSVLLQDLAASAGLVAHCNQLNNPSLAHGGTCKAIMEASVCFYIFWAIVKTWWCNYRSIRQTRYQAFRRCLFNPMRIALLAHTRKKFSGFQFSFPETWWRQMFKSLFFSAWGKFHKHKTSMDHNTSAIKTVIKYDDIRTGDWQRRVAWGSVSECMHLCSQRKQNIKVSLQRLASQLKCIHDEDQQT